MTQKKKKKIVVKVVKKIKKKPIKKNFQNDLEVRNHKIYIQYKWWGLNLKGQTPLERSKPRSPNMRKCSKPKRQI